MKRIQSTALSLALTILPLTSARAGSKPGNPAPMPAKVIFQQIDATSAEVADVAQRLQDQARAAHDPQQQIAGLDTLRKDVNSIGHNLTALEAERSALTPWEVDALDRAKALMVDVAANTEKAIETFNAERTHLWATEYPAETAKASDEAQEVSTLISGYLKLEKARQQEDRLEHNLNAAPKE